MIPARAALIAKSRDRCVLPATEWCLARTRDFIAMRTIMSLSRSPTDGRLVDGGVELTAGVAYFRAAGLEQDVINGGDQDLINLIFWKSNSCLTVIALQQSAKPG
jgi:hypothetical protein